jgi:hypothetical protein
MKDNKYFLLQKDKETISVNTLENNEICELKTYIVNKKTIWATDGSENLATLNTVTKLLEIINFHTNEVAQLVLPYKFEPKSVLLNSDNLFVGGILQNEMLVQFHLKTQKWYSLDIPDEFKYPGKAIDDLLANETQLIAIDNIVYPKYLIYYNLIMTGKVSLSHVLELKGTGTYENITRGFHTENYLGLISDTWGECGAFEFISIYDKKDMDRSFSLMLKECRDLSQVINKRINDLAIIDNTLFFADKEKGLGRFQIKDYYFKSSADEDSYVFNEDAPEAEIKYEQFKGKKIIKLTVIPNTNKVVLTLENWKKIITHKIVEI